MIYFDIFLIFFVIVLYGKHLCYWQHAVLPRNKNRRNMIMAVCGGESIPVCEKYEKTVQSNEMPVIVCSNNENVFPMHEQQWSDRIIQFKTKELLESMMQTYESIHPMGWLDLFGDLI